MKRDQQGHTLIELVVSMAAGSTLMALAIGLVHQTMTMSNVSSERASHDRDSQRLVEQFRWDVHHSEEVQNTADSFVVVRNDAHTVDYQSEGNEVIRIEHRDRNEVRRESYTLAESYVATFSKKQDQQQATLEIRYVPDQRGYADRVDRQITATAGRYRPLVNLGDRDDAVTRAQESP
ncbi:type II secretion system protein J [Novipirellula sp.]|uniref:PulJ/GspJ family protein n=1 Tax=Novipirellula sp. TaxID=2795430 RepID=UPI003561C59C